MRMEASYAAAAAATHPSARSAHLRLAKAYGKLLGTEGTIDRAPTWPPARVTRKEERLAGLDCWENEGGPAGANGA